MANTEGALERLLGRLRQRAFTVCAMNVGTSPNLARMDVKVTVESARPIELAIKQLNKLIDVDGVEIVKAEEHLHAHAHHDAPKPRHAATQHHYHQEKHVAPLEHISFELCTSQIGL